MSEADVPVLIIGAGPTGLVLALWLTRLGVRVRIVDKAAEPGMTSRALGVQARTLELYRQVGLADAVVSAGVIASAVRLWVKGKPVTRVPFGRIGEGLSPFPYMLVYPQDEHERLLIARLDDLGVQVERSVELVRLEEAPGVVHAFLRRADGGEERCEALYVAGCDGAHSAVRGAMGTGFPGGTYAHLFYVADVIATGLAITGEVQADLEATELLAVFPMKGEGRARFIGTIPDDVAARGVEHTFADVSEHAMRQLQITVSKVNWFSTYRVHHRVANQFRVGRAFLLGDAAHIHSPAGGQGMNTGIGDAINLAWKLAAVVNGHAPDGLLDSYEAERIRFARRLVASTDRGFTAATSQGAIASRVRLRLVPLIAPLMTRFRTVRRLMFRTISQTNLNYRGSALSVGSAGDVRGGDRLPWIRLAGGGDNFTVLESLRWQVHVYGDAPAAVKAACSQAGIPLHTFAWTPDMRRAGVARDAVYLVRPDGYVALADPRGEGALLTRYLADRGLVAGGQA